MLFDELGIFVPSPPPWYVNVGVIVVASNPTFHIYTKLAC
jgi:hypothetical protein